MLQPDDVGIWPEDVMDQIEKAKRFSELHVKGTPLVLYNA
jgi:hypothetical protein